MVIGVTGGFCTGKTKITEIFQAFGAKVIDLDVLAHKALERGTKSFRRIIQEFGKDILVNDAISRPLLAKKVFTDNKKLAKLNSIVHPVVIKQMQGLIKKAKGRDIVVEVPLLFEAGLRNYFDYIVVVKANKQTQIKRAMKNKGLNRIDVLRRINSQMPLSQKVKMADFVIDNEGVVKNTYKQAKQIWQIILDDN
jgi:dephospho-CoA kinase